MHAIATPTYSTQKERGERNRAESPRPPFVILFIVLLAKTITQKSKMTFPVDLSPIFQNALMVGEGPRSKVYQATVKNTNITVAVKVIRKEAIRREGGVTAALQAEILQSASESYVRLFFYDFTTSDVAVPYFVHELMDENLAGKGEPRDPPSVKQLMFHLCKELAEMHSGGRVHGFLHPANLFVKSGCLKIGDKGFPEAFSVPVESSMTYAKRIAGYLSPERLETATPSAADDVWAAGCVLAELASGLALFPTGTLTTQLKKNFGVLGKRSRPWEITDDDVRVRMTKLAAAVPQLSAEGIQLLNDMLQEDPGDRISAAAALDHPYFSE